MLGIKHCERNKYWAHLPIGTFERKTYLQNDDIGIRVRYKIIDIYLYSYLDLLHNRNIFMQSMKMR